MAWFRADRYLWRRSSPARGSDQPMVEGSRIAMGNTLCFAAKYLIPPCLSFMQERKSKNLTDALDWLNFIRDFCNFFIERRTLEN